MENNMLFVNDYHDVYNYLMQDDVRFHDYGPEGARIIARGATDIFKYLIDAGYFPNGIKTRDMCFVLREFALLYGSATNAALNAAQRAIREF